MISNYNSAKLEISNEWRKMSLIKSELTIEDKYFRCTICRVFGSAKMIFKIIQRFKFLFANFKFSSNILLKCLLNSSRIKMPPFCVKHLRMWSSRTKNYEKYAHKNYFTCSLIENDRTKKWSEKNDLLVKLKKNCKLIYLLKKQVKFLESKNNRLFRHSVEVVYIDLNGIFKQ